MTTPVNDESPLDFLLRRIDYERMRAMPYGVAELRLGRMRRLLARIGNPHRDVPAVHVAGTKGKGSTSAAVAAILSAAGYRTGLFTSPHLERVEERIAIDGLPCSHDQFLALLAEIQPAVEAMDAQAARRGGDEIGPTFFEILTAAAMLHFAREKTDIAVLEVGLGGRLDSTNVCRPLVSIIVSISFDHMRQLGETLAAIAGEKAGIVKRGVPVVSGETLDEPRQVIRAVCRRRRTRLIERGVDFDFAYRPPQNLETASSSGRMDFFHLGASAGQAGAQTTAYADIALALVGRQQAANAAAALAAVEQLRRQGWSIPDAAVRRGLAELKWPARVEVVARRPAVVIDGAHNVASIEALLETLDESFSVSRRWLLFASTQEKDLRGMIQRVLGRFDEVVFTEYDKSPRAAPAAELEAIARQLSGRPYPVYADAAAAAAAVRRLASPDDLICVTGSLFIAAQMRERMGAEG